MRFSQKQNNGEFNRLAARILKITGQTILGGSASFTGAVTMTVGTVSTSSTTGALVITGGLGVSDNIYSNQNIYTVVGGVFGDKSRYRINGNSNGIVLFRQESASDFIGLAFTAASTSYSGIRFSTTNTKFCLGDGTAGGSVTLTGGLLLAYLAKTANYTLTTTDYLIDCTSNSFILTLPTSVSGQVYVIKNSGSATDVITINTTSGTIDQYASGALTLAQYASVTLMGNGTNYIIQ